MWDTILLILKVIGCVFCLLNSLALLVAIGFAVFSFGRDGASCIANALLDRNGVEIS